MPFFLSIIDMFIVSFWLHFSDLSPASFFLLLQHLFPSVLSHYTFSIFYQEGLPWGEKSLLCQGPFSFSSIHSTKYCFSQRNEKLNFFFTDKLAHRLSPVEDWIFILLPIPLTDMSIQGHGFYFSNHRSSHLHQLCSSSTGKQFYYNNMGTPCWFLTENQAPVEEGRKIKQCVGTVSLAQTFHSCSRIKRQSVTLHYSN